MKKFRVVTKEIHRCVMIVTCDTDEGVEDAIADGQYEVLENDFTETEAIVSVEEVKET